MITDVRFAPTGNEFPEALAIYSFAADSRAERETHIRDKCYELRRHGDGKPRYSWFRPRRRRPSKGSTLWRCTIECGMG